MMLQPHPVLCGCPAAFLATVLDTLPGNIRMMACLRCGQSELADAIVTEDHPHDVQLQGFAIVELVSDARAWADAWPRYIVLNGRRVYLRASARFCSEADLNAAVEAAAMRQQGADLRETLLSLGAPASHPPASLPEELYGFREIWHGLQLSAETPMEELLEAATRFNGPNQLAAEILARRPDLEVWAAAMITTFDEGRRKWGRYLAREFNLTGSQTMAAIRARLAELPDDKTGEISEIGRLLRHLGPAASAARPEVEAAIERVKNIDYYAHKDLTELLARWK